MPATLVRAKRNAKVVKAFRMDGTLVATFQASDPRFSL
jgi:hypothetical protein